MLVPIIIAVVCFAAGVVVAARWLPDLEGSTLGTIAFFVVCGLCGAVVAIVGIEIDVIVRETRHTSGEFVGAIITSRLALIMADGGTVAGLALIAYLLAPKPPREAAPPAAEVTVSPDLV